MRRALRSAVLLAGALFPVVLYTGTAEAATVRALWHMDSLPTMTDSSGNGNNGKATSAVTLVAGFSGKGYHFSKGGVVTVPDSNTLDPGTATIRITAHVRFTNPPGGDYDLIRKGLAGTKGGDWKMEILPTSGNPAPAYCLFQDANGKTAHVSSGSVSLANGAWHTIVCTKTSSSVTVTVDGTARSVSARLGSISNAQPIALGQKPGGGDQYIGDMDEVSISIG